MTLTSFANIMNRRLQREFGVELEMCATCNDINDIEPQEYLQFDVTLGRVGYTDYRRRLLIITPGSNLVIEIATTRLTGREVLQLNGTSIANIKHSKSVIDKGAESLLLDKFTNWIMSQLAKAESLKLERIQKNHK